MRGITLLPCFRDRSERRSRRYSRRYASDKYFVRIYGATQDVEGSTKAAVFKRLVREHELSANQLVTFGDGVEEIRLAKESGGIAVGIARDETVSNTIDPEQSARLIAAGADLIIGDFRVHELVMGYLFDRPE